MARPSPGTRAPGNSSPISRKPIPGDSLPLHQEGGMRVEMLGFLTLERAGFHRDFRPVDLHSAEIDHTLDFVFQVMKRRHHASDALLRRLLEFRLGEGVQWVVSFKNRKGADLRLGL